MSETEKIELLTKGIHILRILLAWEAGELSEGQAATALGVSRVEARILKADAVAAGVKAHDEIKAALSTVNGANMNKTKHELPPAMVEAAASEMVIVASQYDGPPSYAVLASIALEAAGVAEFLLKDRGKTNEINLLTKETKIQAARIAELEVSLVDAFDWIGHLPKSADSASTVSVNDWIRQAAALLKKAQASAGGE